MQIKTPRLFRNRCGVFYFRIKTAEADRRFSLRTKCPSTAAIIALHLNADLERKRAMANPKLSDFNFDPAALRRYELDLSKGIAKADGPEDHARMLEAIDKIGMFTPSQLQARQAMQATIDNTPSPSMPLSKALEVWLAERLKKNAARTVQAKQYHIQDFQRHLEKDVPVNELLKPVIVGYKAALLDKGQTGKTVDNKLMTLHDFFKYLIANAIYTSSPANPVEGLFVLTKRERVKKNEPYQPFTHDELAKFFTADSYLLSMSAPDLFFAPLIGIYTGMRISEATAIACDDVRTVNGVSYIHIPDSKTTSGIRDVPICDALLQLGFLDYVKEVQAAGATRIFPHRPKVNHSYSKELSRAMLTYLRKQGIKKTDDHKSFHSFRVNVITALANYGANTAQVMKITGHKNGNTDDVHLGYVRDLPDLKAVVDRLQWPIDLNALKYDGRFKEFLTDQKNWAA